jgi:hypothetical protein
MEAKGRRSAAWLSANLEVASAGAVLDDRQRGSMFRFYGVMSMHASILIDSVGPPSAEVCRAAASFP